jgi:hypothetical protein
LAAASAPILEFHPDGAVMLAIVAILAMLAILAMNIIPTTSNDDDDG